MYTMYMYEMKQTQNLSASIYVICVLTLFCISFISYASHPDLYSPICKFAPNPFPIFFTFTSPSLPLPSYLSLSLFTNTMARAFETKAFQSLSDSSLLHPCRTD